MEEKKKKKFDWPLLSAFVIDLAIMVVTDYHLRTGSLNEIGLLVGMVALVLVTLAYHSASRIDDAEDYEEKIEQLNNERLGLEQENLELRQVVKNYQSKKKTPKPKKDDD